MRRLALILVTFALLAVGTAAPVAACHVSGHTECEPKGPPGKPNAAWVREILDGNAAQAAHDAVQRALG